MGRVGNKVNDINWDASLVSSPATVLIHCGDVNKVKKIETDYQQRNWKIQAKTVLHVLWRSFFKYISWKGD